MKRILITGASSGVGEAAAYAFAKAGARVLLVARTAEKLKQIAAETGGFAAPCDASDPDAVARMAVAVETQHGTPDVVINAAGAGQWKTLQDTSGPQAMAMMQAPYMSAFLTTKAFLPGMLARRSGVILHVNSPACVFPWKSSVGYAATRAALRGFHMALAQDLVGTGVISSHVIFGKISSPYFDNNPGSAEHMPKLDRLIPTLSPQDCAQILMGLAANPKYEVIHPFMLRAMLRGGALTPRLTRWIARQ
ncbi:MAG: SDR family NAD(P)-dependent oxidoreductase [Roseobacter sp.]